MATPSAIEEIEALELARSRLEAALSDDENWRALRRSQTGSAGAADSIARRARNTRLEMALADNAHFQAWKHLNGAIDALRARSAAQAQAAEPLVRPPPGSAAARGLAALPDDVEALLRSDAPGDAPSHAQPNPPRAEARPPPAAAASPSAPARLVDRLGQLEGPPGTGAEPAAGTGGEGAGRARSRARPQRQVHPVAADPPEATVTFVVRETPAPLVPSAALPPDLVTGLSSAQFERLRGLDEASEPAGRAYAPLGAAAEEAEVTILSADGLEQRREADERAGIVRRFRKALSGD